jgi:hypothetical protein
MGALNMQRYCVYAPLRRDLMLAFLWFLLQVHPRLKRHYPISPTPGEKTTKRTSSQDTTKQAVTIEISITLTS